MLSASTYEVDRLDIPDPALQDPPASLRKDRIALDHHAAVSPGEGEPGRAVLQAVRRADLEDELIAFLQAGTEIIDDAILAVLTEAGEFPGERVARVDGPRRGRGGGSRVGGGHARLDLEQ